MSVRVDDITVGGKDFMGSTILVVHGKVSGRYAVYSTADQVMIQFADDDSEGVNQRTALAPLAALRGQVDAILMPVRDDPRAYQQAKAKEYDWRIGRALVAALGGNMAGAQAELASIKDDLTEDRASIVRTQHLICAGVAAIIAVILARLLISAWFDDAFGPFADRISPIYWNAAAIGAVGALFSIALQMRAREVPIDLQKWDNATDAGLRIFVGAVSAVILVALLRGGFVTLTIGEAAIENAVDDALVVAAFAAGFMERFVSNFFSGLTISGRRQAAPSVPGGGSAPLGSTTNERTVAGNSPGSSAPAEPPLRQYGADLRTDEPQYVEGVAEPEEDETEAQTDEGAAPAPPGQLSNLGPVG